jgi:1-acyl-sn-glycerol-3-phosphate acyltransferase
LQEPIKPSLGRLPYSLYAGALFAALALSALVLILLLPGLDARRRLVRGAARLFLILAGLRLVVLNREHMPKTPCVVVANHSSYLDGVALYAALPARFGFVIKREMARVPLANLLLRRVGAHFVDRGRGQKGARDTRKLLKQAESGSALAFFPEGTFNQRPGLMHFHAGAFLVAARSNFPILPVAILGTRRALPPGGLLARPGSIEVRVLELIPSPPSRADADISAAQAAARQQLLAVIPDPDLDPQQTRPST